MESLNKYNVEIKTKNFKIVGIPIAMHCCPITGNIYSFIVFIDEKNIKVKAVRLIDILAIKMKNNPIYSLANNKEIILKYIYELDYLCNDTLELGEGL